MALRIMLKKALKNSEEIHVLNMLQSELIIHCLKEPPISLSSMAQSNYLRMMMKICEDFEKTFLLAFLDLLKIQ